MVGGAGALIVGVALVLAGVMLVTGASAGALLRRSGHAVRQAGTAARRSLEGLELGATGRLRIGSRTLSSSRRGAEPCIAVDGVEAYPDVVADGPMSAEPPRLLPEPAEDEPTGSDSSLSFDAPTSTEYRLPDRTLLKASPPARGDAADASARTAKVLVQTLANFGVDATIVGTDLRARASSATSCSSRPARRSRRSRA